MKQLCQKYFGRCKIRPADDILLTGLFSLERLNQADLGLIQEDNHRDVEVSQGCQTTSLFIGVASRG